MTRLLQKAETGAPLPRDEIAALLAAKTPADCAALHGAAYRVKLRGVGGVVRLRGLVEASNICARNCLYCGIRANNAQCARYQLSRDEILGLAALAETFRYGSIVIQAGERREAAWVDFITDVVRAVKAQSRGRLGVTLSLGEQAPEAYRQWFDAGAHRYLLRVETASPALYAAIHPAGYDWRERVACLGHLAATGYQVGTGVMCGLPGQTLDDLADDLVFFRDREIHMIGMGPWLPHANTPLGAAHPRVDAAASLRLGLNMIAVARLLMPDANIAATTALQALAPDGRERGLLAGANVIMPNLGVPARRADYALYDNKPGLDENAASARADLEAAIHGIGETIVWDAWGDPPRFAARSPKHGKRGATA